MIENKIKEATKLKITPKKACQLSEPSYFTEKENKLGSSKKKTFSKKTK